MIVGSRTLTNKIKAPLSSSSLFRTRSVVGTVSRVSLASLLLFGSLIFPPCTAFVDRVNVSRRDGIESQRFAAEGPATPANVATTPPERAKLLPGVLRFRGSVDEGYGRGGKKLGVPTANLPSSLFRNALEDVTTGVYFGWAALERTLDSNDDGDGNSELYKAVVNVGYSPTFEGEENKEKIIEAHLIVESDGEEDAAIDNKGENDSDSETTGGDKAFLQDFYGVPMRLQLVGFLREEKKFDSFPELIAQIHADVLDGKLSLNCDPYQSCRSDPFLCTKSTPAWIGSEGGDETASWETATMEGFLDIVK